MSRHRAQIIMNNQRPPTRETRAEDKEFYLKISESFNNECPRCAMPLYDINIIGHQPIPIMTANPAAAYYEKRKPGDYSGVITFTAFLTEDKNPKNRVSCIVRLYEELKRMKTCEHALPSGAIFINGSVAKWTDADYNSPWFAEYMKKRQAKIDNKKAIDIEVK